jgi:hypothetical protein
MRFLGRKWQKKKAAVSAGMTETLTKLCVAHLMAHVTSGLATILSELSKMPANRLRERIGLLSSVESCSL